MIYLSIICRCSSTVGEWGLGTKMEVCWLAGRTCTLFLGGWGDKEAGLVTTGSYYGSLG